MQAHDRRKSTPLAKMRSDQHFANDNESENSANLEDNDKMAAITIRKQRSISEGNVRNTLEEPFEIFPSLPDSVLKKLGLMGGETRNQISEEELEDKFMTLALAFTIDSTTITDRCERQKRFRDQTEANLNSEIDKLIDKVTRIRPLCVDAQMAELITGLCNQTNVIIKASSHASISAERFGAVQHEKRLAESVNLMIKYVTLLKQQRDNTKKQLEYTKRVLQDTNTTDPTRFKKAQSNDRIITKRRASIATFSQIQDTKNDRIQPESRFFNRRTSESSPRSFGHSKILRSKLEFGADLDKIKENNFECIEDSKNNFENSHRKLKNKSSLEDSPFREKMVRKVHHFYENLKEKCTFSSLHPYYFYISTLFCVSLVVIVLAHIFINLNFKYKNVNMFSSVFSMFYSSNNT